MIEFEVYKVRQDAADISPLSVKRDWMDATHDAHAYKCFPVSLANGLGWGLSFPEDITFIWDGISDTLPHHVKILSGEKYVYPDRANATISFNTGLMFKTSPDYTLLQMPVPNQHIDGVSPFTTLISTSFFKGELPCAWRITRANQEIIIKAGTPVISILPISLTNIQNSELYLKKHQDLPFDFFKDGPGYAEKVADINKSGNWSNFYRDAVNHRGESVGEHEVKALRLKVIEGPKACGI
jgi:hypothetical protein